MIQFSVKNQAFYDVALNYSDLPSDLVEITAEQHQELLGALNSGCVVFSDLTYSKPRPDQFHKWNGSAWVDNRTHEQVAEHERSLLPPLTKRQFSLYMYDIGKYDYVMAALNANPRFKIEFNTVSVIERLSPTVTAMGQILEWDDLMINEKWNEALKL